MQNQISPLILSFNASDPVSATGIQADLATFSAMNCRGLSVVTAILTGDTAQVDNVIPLDADLVVEQARTVLEDMQVAAIKVGQTGSLENISAIAEIVSDYPDLPLILDPFSGTLPDTHDDLEDTFLAIRELLIPQATLLVISANELSRLAETWKDEGDHNNSMQTDAEVLLESGCQHVLVTGSSAGSNEIANTLFAASGEIRCDRVQRIPGTYIGAGNTLSAAIAAALANDMEISDAALEAQEYTIATISHAQRLGMGKLVPDHYYWTKQTQ